SDDEVQRMVKDAESHAEEDRARREAIQLRNDAESMTYQADSVLTEYGDKIPAEVKADLENKVQAVRDILKQEGDNTDELKTAHEEMVAALTKVGTSVYESAAGAESNGVYDAEMPEADEAADDATVEGEFREVGN
ncbi:MAG: Hsp70 family protein, partial [Thermomicrobiales bacterium]|nr:Hsp70 family protein [Thermomicrobiales bacterium]